MIFNGDSDNQDLCTLADKLVKTDDTDFPLTEKAMYANMGMREIISWILSVYGGWVPDDSNNTDLPAWTTGLVANQTDYTLPDIIDLFGVSYKIQGGSSWTKLKKITLEEIKDMGYSEAEFQRIAGNPIYYRPVANAIKIYPAANFTQSASLLIEASRDIVPFTSASTDTAPGIVASCHEAVGVFMALMFAKINSLDQEVGLQRMWDGNEEVTKIEGGFKKKIKAIYQARYREHFPGGIRHRNDPVQEYL